MTITNMRLAVDFHCQKASRNYNKYVGVQKARFKNGSTLGTNPGSGSGSQRWIATDAATAYSEAETLFVAQNVGIIAPAPAGIVYITYYVWFKQQRIDTII